MNIYFVNVCAMDCDYDADDQDNNSCSFDKVVEEANLLAKKNSVTFPTNGKTHNFLVSFR